MERNELEELWRWNQFRCLPEFFILCRIHPKESWRPSTQAAIPSLVLVIWSKDTCPLDSFSTCWSRDSRKTSFPQTQWLLSHSHSCPMQNRTIIIGHAANLFELTFGWNLSSLYTFHVKIQFRKLNQSSCTVSLSYYNFHKNSHNREYYLLPNGLWDLMHFSWFNVLRPL